MFDEIMLIKIWTIYGNRLIIDSTMYGPEYGQPGIDLSVLWQSMINLFLYGKETRMGCTSVNIRFLSLQI